MHYVINYLVFLWWKEIVIGFWSCWLSAWLQNDWNSLLQFSAGELFEKFWPILLDMSANSVTWSPSTCRWWISVSDFYQQSYVPWTKLSLWRFCCWFLMRMNARSDVLKFLLFIWIWPGWYVNAPQHLIMKSSWTSAKWESADCSQKESLFTALRRVASLRRGHRLLNSWLLYLKFVKIREFYEIFKIRKIHVGTFLVTTSFRIYSEATVEWKEWAVDDSCSDTEEHNDIPNDPWYTILVNWLTVWQQLTNDNFVRFDFCTYLQFITTLYLVRLFIRLWCWLC